MNIRRLFSAFFLLLIVFNSVGYYGVLVFMEHQLTARMHQKIADNGAQLGGNLMLSFPLHTPYGHDSENYEMTEGEMVYQGEVYQLVKQKIYHNVLYVICVKDDKSTHIREVMDEYSRTFTNQQPDNSDSAVKIVVSFAKYFLLMDFPLRVSNEGWYAELGTTQCCEHYSLMEKAPIFRPPIS